MADKAQYIYWDSCAFIKFLNQEDEWELCEGTIQQAMDGNIFIVTSALTAAEVLKCKGFGKLEKDKRQDVELIFRHPYIRMRDVTRRTSEIARNLFWDHNIDPKDALHVATALEARLETMHTFDKNLIKKSKLVGDPVLEIKKPDVKFEKQQEGIDHETGEIIIPVQSSNGTDTQIQAEESDEKEKPKRRRKSRAVTLS